MSGVLERHPDMTVCLAHAGGASAAVAGRLERGQVTGRPGADTGAQKPRLAFKRFCVDCIAHDADALKLAAAMHGRTASCSAPIGRSPWACPIPTSSSRIPIRRFAG